MAERQDVGPVIVLPRLATGVPYLDEVLDGGFYQGSIYLIVGPPGSGKTILASQIAVHHARVANARCLYVTLLAESHQGLISHLSTLSFFDPEQALKSLYFLSGYSSLREAGLAGLLRFVIEAVHQLGVDMVILDGLDNAAERAADTIALREFIMQLQAIGSLLPCTFLLLSLAGEAGMAEIQANVDGVIELDRHFVGTRMVRSLAVHKLRGSAMLAGRHFADIRGDGFIVYPRLESRYADLSLPPDAGFERMALGIPGLDAMLHGGLLANSAAVILGVPGSGKTLAGLTFLVEGARQGQPGLLFGFYEPPERLLALADGVGLPLRQHVDAGLIRIIWNQPAERSMDELANLMLDQLLPGHDARPRRLFLDSLSGFRLTAVYQERFPEVVAVLANQLRARRVTALFSEEMPLFTPEVALSFPALASLVDAVIAMRTVESGSQLLRAVSIMKLRESAYDPTIRRYRIDAHGFTVTGIFGDSDRPLSGESGSLPGPSPQADP